VSTETDLLSDPTDDTRSLPDLASLQVGEDSLLTEHEFEEGFFVRNLLMVLPIAMFTLFAFFALVLAL
jgi:hypothetical protein